MDEAPAGSGHWEWSGYIRWYELWADVDGTRVETPSSDPDIQVDAYVDGSTGFLILNNLETNAARIAPMVRIRPGVVLANHHQG